MSDRLVLGGVILAATQLVGWQVQRREKAIEYQQSIFDRRLEAYAVLLADAREARDEFALLLPLEW